MFKMFHRLIKEENEVETCSIHKERIAWEAGFTSGRTKIFESHQTISDSGMWYFILWEDISEYNPETEGKMKETKATGSIMMKNVEYVIPVARKEDVFEDVQVMQND